MKDIYDYMNYGFETYNQEGKVINRIDGPGSCGEWLADIFESPYEMAIIPANIKSVSTLAAGSRCLRTDMFPLDADFREIEGRRIDATLFEGSEKKARDIATELGCGVYFWSSYEETRFIVIVSALNETDFPGSDEWTYYTVTEF